MPAKKINYISMMNSALLDVVKKIVSMVSTNGFYKKQHLYITFATKHPGVHISAFLKEEFDEDMTIILEHEFWDLIVDSYGFSVSLEFEHASETVYVPFSSITTFLDPSEDFSLEFLPNFADINETQKQNSNKINTSNNIISLDMFRKGK